MDHSAGHHLENDPVNLPQRFLTGLGALGLVITTALASGPAPAAFADPLPDVAVTYTGFNYGANGMLDVAFNITSNGAAASMTLNTTCAYHKMSDNSFTRNETGKISLGIPQGQQAATPKLVTCVPWTGEFVSSVVMQADVAGGDANPNNNGALWHYASNLPHPDVKVGYFSRQTFANGSVNVLFGLLNPTNQDAPVVNLHYECNYHSNATKQYTYTTKFDDKTSVPHQTSGVAYWAKCAPIAGQYVNSVVLSADVQKPYVDANPNNNGATWDRTSVG